MKNPLHRIRKFFARLLLSDTSLHAVETRVRYLQYEISQLHSLVRYLLPGSANYQSYIHQTLASFEYQWANLDEGAHLVTDPEFQQNGTNTLLQNTGLDKEWFRGKQVLDAGCGNGRWSWVLCKLGANVTAFDQSSSGVKTALQLNGDFPSFKAFQANILEDLGMPKQFDLVWSFGVVHHTGNSWLAIQNIAACVKHGGYLYLMVYGEPRWDHIEDFQELNHYIELRRALTALDFDGRVSYLRQHKEEKYVHGFFDATSPRINDLHTFNEVVEWLRLLGFTEIRRTIESRNMMIMARRRNT